MMNPNDRYVLTEMLAVVKSINPDYPSDPDLDFMAIRKIAQFIYKQMQSQDFLVSEPSLFMKVWEQLYTTAFKDPFYSDKSLATIANHIQEFYQKAKHEHSANSKFKDKFAARLKQKR